MKPSDLIAEFRKHDWSASGRASAALAAMGRAAVVPLIASLADDDGYVRAGAAVALGEIGDVTAVEPLLVAVRNKGTGPTPDGENGEAQAEAAGALARLGDRRAVPVLLEVLDRALGNDVCTCWYVIDALAVLGDESLVARLIPLLGHADIDVRKSAAAAVARLKGR